MGNFFKSKYYLLKEHGLSLIINSDTKYQKNTDLNTKANKIIELLDREYKEGATITDEIILMISSMYSLKEIEDPNYKDEICRVYELAFLYPQICKEGIGILKVFYHKRIFTELNLYEKLAIACAEVSDELVEDVIKDAILAKMHYADKWVKEANLLDIYKKEYGERYIEYLKAKMKETYIDASDIILSMPSCELILEDERIANNISNTYGINLVPYSYLLTIKHAMHEPLDINSGYLYYETPDESVLSPITIPEYLSDVRRQKRKEYTTEA